MILDNDYREYFAVSNSGIKDYLKDGPKKYYDKYIDPTRVAPPEFSTESTDIGDLADCLVTTPHLFDKFYYIMSNVPGAAVKGIVEAARNYAIAEHSKAGLSLEDILEKPDVKDAKEARVHLMKAAGEYINPENGKAGYRSNFKPDTLFEYLIDKGGDHYKDLTVAAGRRVIDMELHNTALNVVKALKEDSITGPIINMESSEGIEVLHQHMVTVEINGMECKILLDWNMIDHKRKWIYPKDVKTAMSHKQFRINYQNFLYGNQASFYTGVLKAKYPGYSVAPFEFIVAPTESGEDPMIYRSTPSELAVYANGATLKSGRKIIGWLEVINLMRWHTQNGLWRFPKEYYENSFMPISSNAEESIDALGDGADADDMF